MPFASTARPSLALGILKAQLQKEGFKVDVYDFNLLLSALIGTQNYEFLCGTLEFDGYVIPNDLLLGEWIFASHFHHLSNGEASEYVSKFLVDNGWEMPENLRQVVLDVQKFIPTFISLCQKSAPWFLYGIVGFTNSFEQTFSSLLLSRVLKRSYPTIRVAFGGANCESIMGEQLIRSYEHIDFVATSEADFTFPQLCKQLRNASAWERTPGFCVRRNNEIFVNGDGPLTENLDDLPIPIFDDFFRYAEILGQGGKENKGLFLEASRGCWWGAKNHCSFCGLNGRTMKYREKTSSRVIEELFQVTEKYSIKNVDFTDNIMSHHFHKTVLPELASRGHKLRLFFETKSNLKRHEVKQMADASIVAIQPGIESFSDSVLHIIGKGVSGAQNVALLKWGMLYSIDVAWNLLYGFPGEPSDDYDALIDIIPSLSHLAPPQAVAQVRLDRFSPNFTQSEQRGFFNVTPMRTYEYVYRLDRKEIVNLAYYFEYESKLDTSGYAENLVDTCNAWKNFHHRHRPRLELIEIANNKATILDTRQMSRSKFHEISELGTIILLASDDPSNKSQLLKAVLRLGFEEKLIIEEIAMLKESRLLLELGGLFVGLALIEDQFFEPMPNRHFLIGVD
jgi:ribosomal peptide maturation radical SAM protein 1